jgi:hypothetical protein
MYDSKDPTSATPDTRQEASNMCEQRIRVLNEGRNGLNGIRIGIPQVKLCLVHI